MNLPASVSADVFDECPACGAEVAAVTPLALPAAGELNPGGCLVAAVEGEHFELAVHPDYRPDVLCITHGGRAQHP